MSNFKNTGSFYTAGIVCLHFPGQVDLWTQKAKGCRCPFDTSRQDCACCVRDGGCHCGKSSPNRCSQCGLEQHCSNMCNITIDSKVLSARSGRRFGQIKSPSLVGPGFCWYLLQPDTGQRVELQIYRLVSVGRFNGSSCESGSLQLIDGGDATPRPGGRQVCGGNERYAPPVVLFADRGPATLLFHITEATLRSQFLAYFSFTPRSSKHGVGFQPKGGKPIEHTECDWLYQDFSCREQGSCVLASPGYPGLYPPNQHCKYYITTSSIHTQVTINFTSLLLPHNHCGTDYINIYHGSSTSSKLLKTLCSNKKTKLQYPGPNLLLEFRWMLPLLVNGHCKHLTVCSSSGSPVPPHDYSGFLATLEFSEKLTTTEPSPVRTTENDVLMDGTTAPRHVTSSHSGCELFFSGNETRSGHFDTRGLAWSSSCSISFTGRQSDIVQISLFNYMLRFPSCTSSVDVYDGVAEPGVKPSKRVCSPSTKHARDPGGRFFEPERFVSTDNILTLILKRSSPTASPTETEFVDGAFLFHDERMAGTPKPDTLCDVDYYGLSSPHDGRISNPGTQDLYWNIEGVLRCSQRFIPATNQSVTVTVWNLARLSSDTHCHTQCGDGGCRCVANLLPLNQLDHLLLITDSGHAVSCLCGDFAEQWFPVSLRTWSALRVVYSVAHYTWNMKGFTFNATYNFTDDSICSHAIITQPSGEINSKNVTPPSMNLNYYYHQECTWLLDSKVERQLVIELETAQNRPCTAWNMSVHRYEVNRDGGTGELLHTFCPRDRNKRYAVPWKVDTVLLRLRAMTRTPPIYSIRWRSLIVQANTRVSGPTPPTSRAPHCPSWPSLVVVAAVLGPLRRW